MKTFLLSSFVLAAASVGTTHGVGIRGGRVLFQEEGGEFFQDHRLLSSKEVTDLQLCGKVDVSETSNGPKYFWMAITDTNKNKMGSCLLTIPKGTTDDDFVCCTANNGSPVQYSSSYNLVITDPHAITDETSAAYKLCGAQGGTQCPDYDYDINEIGFTSFQTVDGGDNDTVLQKMNHFIWSSKGKCGLTSKGALCDVGYQEYEHAHVGKGYCLQGGVTLSKQGSGCTAWGWRCVNSDC